MTEGVRFRVTYDEMKEHCLKKAVEYLAEVNRCEAQIEQERATNPRKAWELKERKAEYTSLCKQFEFMASHVFDSYVLTIEDLYLLRFFEKPARVD